MGTGLRGASEWDDYHFAVQAIIANGIQAGWPFPYLEIDGVPLAYNYLIHVHMASASSLAKIPTADLAMRLTAVSVMVQWTSSFYCMAVRFCRSRLAAVLFLIQIYAIAGYSNILFGWFGHALPQAAFLVLSTAAAFPVFAYLAVAFQERLQAGDRSAGPLVLILLAIFVACGTRAPAAIAFIAGGSMFLAGSVFRKRPAWDVCLTLIASALLLAASLKLFYGAGTKYAASSFLKFVLVPHLGALPLPSAKPTIRVTVARHSSGVSPPAGLYQLGSSVVVLPASPKLGAVKTTFLLCS